MTVRQGALILSILGLAMAAGVAAQETERLYLSGTDPEETRSWEFSVDRGRRSGEWTTIPVPSQWELEGFGEFAYGRDDEVRAEVGSYHTRFTIPDRWKGRRVLLVFEGAMTDLEARLNGQPVGEPHRGGFTRFSYDVTSVLRFEDSTENVLEIEVSEASSEASVNAAEREADYWVFGGIYRPVYLEARPAIGIEHVAVDARHDGSLRVAVEMSDEAEGILIAAQIADSRGAVVGTLPLAPGPPDGLRHTLAGRIPKIVPWSAERPSLYELEVELSRGGEVLHRVRRRFGFRTVEVRAGEGLFVNGRRTLLKGINRHSFWPTTGRTLSRAQNRRDAELIKELNANAVRTSHYPPDIDFLEACDELGLYVIDELPGWHDAYRSGVGRGLVSEMVRRDVNHPSIILWASGNEGGWNRALDGEFGRHDVQDRPVIHPQSVWGGFDTTHYPSWEELRAIVAGEGLVNRLRRWRGPLPLVMPTEMLHGLYDGGLGAGLAEYWELIRSSPRGAGAFLWAFLDEAVVRGDRGGELDSYGNYGPDGLVGPYRDKEPSFATVRSVWSPVVLAGDGDIRPGSEVVHVPLENRFAESDLAACRFRWRWLRWPGTAAGGGVEILAHGAARGPKAAPRASGELTVGRVRKADALELSAFDPAGRHVATWVLPMVDRSVLLERWVPESGGAGGRSVDSEYALGSLRLRAPQVLPPGSASAAKWREFPSGWLRLEVDVDSRATAELRGILFPAAFDERQHIEWLGRGPTPVWRNRRAGPELGVWSGPVRPGFYDGVVWARIPDHAGTLIVVIESPDLFVGFSAPRFPEDARFARAAVPPPGSLSVLWSIPAMGSKFQSAAMLGPPMSDAQPEAPGPVVVWLLREASGR